MAAGGGEGGLDTLIAEVSDSLKDEEVRSIPLPAGWEGLSIKLCGERVVVSEVPKACFSSKAGQKNAKPQVDGVEEGDEIMTLNGDPVHKIVERILTKGDPLNACSTGEEKFRHAVGSKTKFDSPPCAACDFKRRKGQLGLDVALQMWLRAVKREIRIVLGVRTGGKHLLEEATRSLASTAGSAANGAARASTVVELKATDASAARMEAALAKLCMLDDGNRKKAKEAKETGKGKAKGKGKGKGKKPTGPDLPRTRLTSDLVTGQVNEWKDRGKFGWIKPTQPVDHPQAHLHRGRLYIHTQDLPWWVEKLTVGQYVRFHVYVDTNSLGAEECTVLEEDGGWDASWDAALDAALGAAAEAGAAEAAHRERSRSRGRQR